MPTGSFVDFSSKKAFEIAYAVLRLSDITKRRSFSDRLENHAIMLVESVLAMEYGKARESLWILQYIVKLGADVNILSLNNSSAIIAECEGLSSAIAEFGSSATLPDIDFQAVFSKGAFSEDEKKNKKEESISKKRREIKEKGRFQEEINTEDSAVRGGGIYTDEDIKKFITVHNSAKIAEYAAQVRKNAIIERIREKGDCKAKDIMEVVPELNERTLRHDLQILAEQGIIERVGNTGSSTYYRIKGDKNEQKDDSFEFDIEKIHQEFGATFIDEGSTLIVSDPKSLRRASPPQWDDSHEA